MAKTYINATLGTDALNSARKINVAAPFDVRAVVDSYEDLFTKSTGEDSSNGFTYGELYVGMIVSTVDTHDVYVLTGLPGKRDSATAWRNNIQWKKVNSVDFDPSQYLPYYQEKLGAKILNSADGLVGISNPFIGQFAYVKDDPNTSEDESGLYIYTGQGWKRIFTGNNNSGSGINDISQVITSDGTIPESGNGFSIIGNDPQGYIEEIYVDDYLHAGVYYSSKGINSSKTNGGDELDNVDKIKLSNGGNSYIELRANGDMKIYIADNTLGFGKDDISIIDSNNTEYDHPYASQSLPVTIPALHLGNGYMIKFDVDVDFTGMTETRDENPTEYVFGSTGSKYNDIDFYAISVLPTVYAYSNNESVKILTEGDKEEIISSIPSIQPISNQEILNLFV